MVDNYKYRPECSHLETIYPTLRLLTILEDSLNVTETLSEPYVLEVTYHWSFTYEYIPRAYEVEYTRFCKYSKETVPLVGFTLVKGEGEAVSLIGFTTLVEGESTGTVSVSQEQLEELKRQSPRDNSAFRVGVFRDTQWVKISIRDNGEIHPHMRLEDTERLNTFLEIDRWGL